MNLNKKEILFISARFPYPLHKGDQLVLFNNIRLVSKDYSITLLTMYDEDSELENLDKLKLYCKEIISVKRSKTETYFNLLLSPLMLEPLQVAYYKSSGFKTELNKLLSNKSFDIIHVYMLRIAHYVKDLRNYKVLSLVDSMALNMSRRVQNESGIKKLIFKYESILINNYEKNMLKNFDKAIVVSNIDKEHISETNIEVIPIGIDMQKCNVEKNSKKVVFSGNMGYFPNQNAVLWFIEHCLEKIKNDIPDLEFVVVGKNPPKKVSNYHDGKNIIIKGYVDSMIDELYSASLAIAPMQSGSGMQIKVLEAMSVGLPIVATELGRGDISAIDQVHLLISNDSNSFVKNCIKLLNDHRLRDTIGISAKKFIEDYHSWQTIYKQYSDVYNVENEVEV